MSSPNGASHHEPHRNDAVGVQSRIKPQKFFRLYLLTGSINLLR